MNHSWRAPASSAQRLQLTQNRSELSTPTQGMWHVAVKPIASGITVGWHLQGRLISCKSVHKRDIEWERQVDQTNDNDQRITNVLRLGYMALRDKHRRHLLPTQAGMRDENEHGKGVKVRPDWILENLELRCIDVPHADLDISFISPEKVKTENTFKVDHELRGSNIIGSKLVCVAKAELEQVDRHEGHQHQPCHCQIQHAESLGFHQREFLVPCTFEPHT